MADSPDALPPSLELQHIRETLIRQEDTIIFALIERAQYARNAPCYAVSDERYRGLAGSGRSFLDFMLLETERLHARVRRYTSPDEHAFFPNRLPPPQLPLIDFPAVLAPCVALGLNDEIMRVYLSKVLPGLCREGDDEQHGSTVVSDVAVLQAISKRVHYGFFVAESKFRGAQQAYTDLIRAGDEDGIMALLTNEAVEAKVLRRVHRKACTFGQEVDAADADPAGKPADRGMKVDPELVVSMYREHVIPLTKVAEVRYLLQRLGSASVAHEGGPGSACGRAALRHFAGSAPPAGSARAAEAPLLRPCATAAEVVEAVTSNRAFYGVAMLERADAGVSRELLEQIAASPLAVVGELVDERRLQLVCVGPLESVLTVAGTPDALRLAAEWLRGEVPHSLDLEYVDDAALAERTARIGAGEAGGAGVAYLVDESFVCPPGTRVLLRSPEQLRERARYVVLCKRRAYGAEPTGADRSLVMFTLRDEAGSLAEALACLNRHGINMAYIHSYSTSRYCERATSTTSTFVAEVEGHEKEELLQRGLAELGRLAASLKVLGSFPRRAADAQSAYQRLSPRSVS